MPREITCERPPHWEASIGTKSLGAKHRRASLWRYPSLEIFVQNVCAIANSGFELLTAPWRTSAAYINNVGFTQCHNDRNSGLASDQGDATFQQPWSYSIVIRNKHNVFALS